MNTLDWPSEGGEGGDDLPGLPLAQGPPDHEAGEGERWEEEDQPQQAVQPAGVGHMSGHK